MEKNDNLDKHELKNKLVHFKICELNFELVHVKWTPNTALYTRHLN